VSTSECFTSAVPGAGERESAILEAAEALLEEGASFAALKVEDIARRAGLGRTNFYFYFSDKRALLERLAEGAADELYAEAERWWLGKGEGSAELGRIVAPVVALWMRHGAVLSAIVQAATLDDEIRDFWRALAARFVDATRERIEREQKAGLALDAPAGETAFALVWMTERSCYQHVQQGGGSTETLVRALTLIWQRSVYGHGAE